MKNKIFTLILAGLFFSVNISYAGDLLSLAELIKEARENNPELLAAKKRWEAALVRIPKVKSLDSPGVSFSFMKIQKGTLKLNETMPEDRMLSISQMFPLFGKLSLKEKMALVESQMFAAEYKNKELEIINEIKIAYYDYFLNQKELELNRGGFEFLEAIAKIAEARYVLGDISQEEVFKIDSEIARLNNEIINLKQKRSSIRTRINTLLNRDPEGLLAAADLGEDISFQPDIKSLYQATLLNQPELLVFSYAIERNKLAKDLAERGLFPDLMAEIGLRGITSGGLGPWDLMLAFTVPFWFWTKQRYEIKEAIVNLEEARAAYAAMQNKSFREVKDLAVKIEIAANNIRLHRDNLIPILESSIQASLAGFRSGEAELMMILDNERMLIEAKMNYYQALVEYNMNLADLERTLGLSLSEVKK